MMNSQIDVAMRDAYKQYQTAVEKAGRKRDETIANADAVFRHDVDDAQEDYNKRVAEIDAQDWPEELPPEQPTEEVTDAGTAAPTEPEAAESGGGDAEPTGEDGRGPEGDPSTPVRRRKRH